MNKKLITFAGFHGFTSIVAGVIGAHVLKSSMSAQMLTAFEVGVRYQMYHAIALLALAAISSQYCSRASFMAGLLFFIGPLIFAGSIYTMAITGDKTLGNLAPVGGIMMMAGWLILFVSSLCKSHKTPCGSHCDHHDGDSSDSHETPAHSHDEQEHPGGSCCQNKDSDDAGSAKDQSNSCGCNH